MGSGENFGNEDILTDSQESDDEDDDWEDMEDWKMDPPFLNNSVSISTSNKWNTLPTCPPKPVSASSLPHHKPPTHHMRNHNCISALNNAYGLNGSLSESSESVPVQPPPEYQVGNSQIFQILIIQTFQMNHHGLHRPLSFNESQVRTVFKPQHSCERRR